MSAVRHHSAKTEACYVRWAARFIRFHGMRHPNTMGGPEIELFLTHLAVNDHVAASTQNQALNALLFLYVQVLGIELPRLDAVRGRPPRRLPNVLAPEEVRSLLEAIEGGTAFPAYSARSRLYRQGRTASGKERVPCQTRFVRGSDSNRRSGLSHRAACMSLPTERQSAAIGDIAAAIQVGKLVMMDIQRRYWTFFLLDRRVCHAADLANSIVP